MNLEGKVAIVTGCSSGIGLAATHILLSHSALVFGVDLRAPKDETLVSHSGSSTSPFAFHQADISSSSAIETLAKECLSRFNSRIDILLNIAGVMDSFASAGTVTDGELEKILAINLQAPIKLMRAVIPTMQRQKSGAIVNVGSRAATTGGTSGIAYTASKHGLVSFALPQTLRLRMLDAY